MKKNTNIFVLTTEYHFLLSMNIIHERYSSTEFNNVLVFTGERLSAIVIKNLPVNVEVIEINVEREGNLKEKIHDTILQYDLANLFVFTAYRDLETYLLSVIDDSVGRHLVQDGANFYFNILKPVMWSRIKETIKIYRNLWRKGIFLKKLVLYKKNITQCGFIDYVWVTNPEVYEKPRFSSRPVVKIKLLDDERIIESCLKYFAMNEQQDYSNTIIYLSSRLTQENAIVSEIAQLQSVITRFKCKVLIKLHPNAPPIQVNLFNSAFKDCVVKNFIPAELYIAKATNSYVIGTASAALYYYNSRCVYFSLVKIYQGLGIFPEEIEVKLPAHVKVIENLNELNTNCQ